MIGLYERLLETCGSENQRNRVHILLENRMTPEELVALRAHYVSSGEPGRAELAARRALGKGARLLPHRSAPPETVDSRLSRATIEHTQSWIGRLYGLFLHAGDPAPVACTRRHLRHDVVVFSDGGPRERKTLLLCFSGNAHRMMLPMPVFLQNLRPPDVDVVWLRTQRGQGYRTGIRGISDSLATSIEGLRILLKPEVYRRLAVMGTSGGGLPAIMTGLQLGADAVLSVGGNNPHDERWSAHGDGTGVPERLRQLSEPLARRPDICLVHGANHGNDAVSAAAVAAILPRTRTVSVRGADHNALVPLLQRRRLRALFESTIVA